MKRCSYMKFFVAMVSIMGVQLRCDKSRDYRDKSRYYGREKSLVLLNMTSLPVTNVVVTLQGYGYFGTKDKEVSKKVIHVPTSSSLGALGGEQKIDLPNELFISKIEALVDGVPVTKSFEYKAFLARDKDQVLIFSGKHGGDINIRHGSLVTIFNATPVPVEGVSLTAHKIVGKDALIFLPMVVASDVFTYPSVIAAHAEHTFYIPRDTDIVHVEATVNGSRIKQGFSVNPSEIVITGAPNNVHIVGPLVH